MTIDRSARLVLALALVFSVYMALNPHPPMTPIDRYGDKVGHMTAFATLAILTRLSFPRARALLIIERLAFFGALIEVFQAIPSLHRDCDWHDWVADVIALCVTLAIWDGMRGWLRRQRLIASRR